MILPVSIETAGKIRGCLLKLSDCWKPPSCSLRALSTDPGCCCHCQPGEATAQLDPSLAVFWLKIREMRTPTCKDTKPSRQSVQLIGNFCAPLTSPAPTFDPLPFHLSSPQATKDNLCQQMCQRYSVQY